MQVPHNECFAVQTYEMLLWNEILLSLLERFQLKIERLALWRSLRILWRCGSKSKIQKCTLIIEEISQSTSLICKFANYSLKLALA